ncbi:acyl-CoA synthetase (AMP-forming)/AMP-acid ligase II [Kitasatospora sp. MAA4]|uniref:non-ribosomal peptide synthetase n=1 Tax=Kitasatospora sp. MAA4 TaxID=3035093 RepID=UPI002473D2AD|nr:non-ribosomal peptide synthetase [Kitasatospora sp. MAA4]MDH6135331.1 acyl-CoA synthetase (AMP-forming)/AMP-acid ligase II [Kitasatospora sp. MAA4]
MNRTQLLDLLAERTATMPQAPALLTPEGQSLSYSRLDALVRTTVARLIDLGVTRQDRVVVCAPNDMDGVILQLAVISTAVCCPVNPLLAQDEFEHALDLLQPSAVITFGTSSAKLLRAAERRQTAVIEAVPHLFGDPLELLFQGGELDPARVVTQPVADESLLLRTSGTTSAGKLVPLAMSHLMAGATASVRAFGLDRADRCLNVMPMFHIQGLVGSVVASLVAGSSVVLLPAFDAKQTLRSLEDTRATWFSASPTIHRLLLDRLREEPADCTSLRFARSGAATLPSALREELEVAYGVPILETYGMSEAHQIASTLLPDGSPRAIGMVPTGSRVGVLDSDGTVRTEPGSSGELVVSGSNVIERYVNPEDGEAAFTGGWLRTGDLGRIAVDGSVQVTGRVKEMINRGGEKVSPYEVEEALLRHPAVRQAVAFGVPDEVFTEKVVALVVLHEGRSADEPVLRAHSVAQLAPFKVPARIMVREELAVNAVGKLVRADFAREFTDAAEAPPAVTATPAARVALPQTPVEAAMAGLWAYALERGTLGGLDEDFFTAGGESVSAVTLLRGIKDTFGVEISAAGLFDELNTVERLADAVTRAIAEKEAS